MSLKNQYSKNFSHFLELLSIFIGLSIYYYVSIAFGGSVESGIGQFGGSYFEYVVFGEIFMTLPLYFLDAPFRKLKSSIVEGTFLTYISLPISVNRLIFVLASWNLIQVLKRLLFTVLIAVVFFGFSFKVNAIFYLFILSVLSSFVFLGIGLCVASLLMIFGRGASALGYLNTFIAVTSGSYFPLSVLPEWIIATSKTFSPFTLFLESSRMIHSGRVSFQDFLITSLVLLFWGGLLFLGRYFFSRSLDHYRKNGRFEVISHY
jgi:ABC-type uncharacterized transport system permease subunit